MAYIPSSNICQHLNFAHDNLNKNDEDIISGTRDRISDDLSFLLKQRLSAKPVTIPLEEFCIHFPFFNNTKSALS